MHIAGWKETLPAGWKETLPAGWKETLPAGWKEKFPAGKDVPRRPFKWRVSEDTR
jgi:hypothetical protein